MIIEAFVTQSESEHSSISVGIFPVSFVEHPNAQQSFHFYPSIETSNEYFVYELDEKKEGGQKKIRAHWKVKETNNNKETTLLIHAYTSLSKASYYKTYTTFPW
jgi:hypothetical protein